MLDIGNNLRKFKRRHLINYLEIFDDETDRFLGYLIDLTVNGLKMVSREEMMINKVFHLRLTLPEEYCKDQQVVFTARSVWCSPDGKPGFYAIGFNAPQIGKNIREIFMFMIKMAELND